MKDILEDDKMVPECTFDVQITGILRADNHQHDKHEIGPSQPHDVVNNLKNWFQKQVDQSKS